MLRLLFLALVAVLFLAGTATAQCGPSCDCGCVQTGACNCGQVGGYLPPDPYYGTVIATSGRFQPNPYWWLDPYHVRPWPYTPVYTRPYFAAPRYSYRPFRPRMYTTYGAFAYCPGGT